MDCWIVGLMGILASWNNNNDLERILKMMLIPEGGTFL